MAEVFYLNVSVLDFKGTLRLAFKRTRMGVSIEVNPARSLGKEMLDAGRVIFTKGSRLDFNRSFGPLGANLAVYHFFRVSIPRHQNLCIFRF